MKIPSITQLLQRYRHLLTIQNAGLAIAVIIALSWVWGSVVTLQKNYKYQRQVDDNNQQIELTKLQNKTLEYQQAYFKSDEFLELSARAKLGLALPGEHLVLLPSSEAIKDTAASPKVVAVTAATESNFARWMRFLFESH
jgi:cell division protein FtsL